MLKVGRAGGQRRLQLPPRPGVGEPASPTGGSTWGPHLGLGLLTGLLRQRDAQVEHAGCGAAHRGRQQSGRQERRRHRRQPPAGGGQLLLLLLGPLHSVAQRRLGARGYVPGPSAVVLGWS